MADYRVTVRYGERYQRYHTFEVEAPDVARALEAAAELIPDDVLPQADLVELRPAVDPGERGYLGEE
ncbi:MAG TPA: hypothetical protein VGB42_09580 [Candidatus Thermoplasmatota archaeon]